MKNKKPLKYKKQCQNRLFIRSPLSGWRDRLGALLAIGFCFGSPLVLSASIRGQVEVWSKDEKDQLKTFDNAVVYLQGVSTTQIPAAVNVDQKNKKFNPRILPIIQGQTVNFYNQDPISHNVFSTDKKMPFDLGRYPQGEYKQVSYPQKGLHKVYCNIHQSMILDVLVLDNPYFSVSDEQGFFSIDNVPDGDYQLKVWHIYGGEYSQPLQLKNESVELPKIKLVNSSYVKDVIQHKNKEGEDYRNRRRGKRGRY